MDTTGVFALLLVLAGACFAVIRIERKRHSKRIDHTPVLFVEAMRRFEITPADAALAGREKGVILAAQKCENCLSEGACRTLMSNSFSAPPPSGCPNQGFFEDVRDSRAALKESSADSPLAPLAEARHTL